MVVLCVVDEEEEAKGGGDARWKLTRWGKSSLK